MHILLRVWGQVCIYVYIHGGICKCMQLKITRDATSNAYGSGIEWVVFASLSDENPAFACR